MRHNTLYGVLQRGWCITAFGRTPVYASEYIPRMVQNRTGFEVAKEEEAEKMTGRREGGRKDAGKGEGGGGREDQSGVGVAAAVKERLGYGGGDKGRQ